MARMRFMAVAMLALALAGNSTPMGRTQADETPKAEAESPRHGWNEWSTTVRPRVKAAKTDDRSCVIYSLSDLGYDADLGQWIAQTIPEMIEPSSWKDSGGSGVLRYYAPKNILMVNHSAAVQSKVEGFLKNLKTSLPKASRTGFASGQTAPRASVIPAEYNAPAPLRNANPLSEGSSYPVPAPVKAPKHLFHFLIRYEGEGIIDDNVVKFMKGYIDASKDGSSQVPVQATARGYPTPSGASGSSACIPAGVASLTPATVSAPSPSVTAAPSVAPPVAQPKESKAKKEEPKEDNDPRTR